MTDGVALAKQGLCELCRCPTPHGPWTDAQIQEVCQDIGIEAIAFGDTCDDCFVEEVGRGDAVYAQSLLDRPLKLKNPAHLKQLSLTSSKHP